ncbi:YcaO-like family protein [Buchananella hordeovulneris]|uniref:YcaO domain-containing protein n=1 Tax=Buchananella hordeovulneris TaxID=52770 RepID=A0A1Q5PTA9_9ACTO|nr:YcaO-like family protein [Buchananella hordeovulneris]OKL50794.1 hypothetical protein BSZ40_10580 [Buchananella hordeovulneris]
MEYGFAPEWNLYYRLAEISAIQTLRDGTITGSKALIFGSGWSEEECENSFIGECIERRLALNWNAEEFQWRTVASVLKAGNCFVLSDMQMQLLSSVNSEVAREEVAIPWMPGYFYGRDKDVDIPADLVWLDTFKNGVELKSVRRTSNGLAAGNTLQMARENAFHELVERDAVLRWWWGLQEGARIGQADLASLGLDQPSENFEAFDALVIGAENDVLTVVVTLRKDRLSFFGSGSGWSTKTALNKALKEAVLAYVVSRNEEIPWIAARPKSLSERQFYHNRRHLLPFKFAVSPVRGGLLQDRSDSEKSVPGLPEDLIFLDLGRACGAYVLRALCPRYIPLDLDPINVFPDGAGCDVSRSSLCFFDGLSPHPIY